MTARKVGPLSRRAIFKPVSHPLQEGFRFFPHPLPTEPSTFLAVRLPLPAALWVYPVPHESPSGADPSSSPAVDIHDGPIFKDHSSPHTVLVQAYQHVWLAKIHDVYRKFTYVGRTHSSLAPLRPHAGRFRFASRLRVPILGGYIVPRASHRAVTGSA